ncbi:MAG: hypothetical protein Q4F28_14825 [Eubacteriales bacterium]|nr:hypothetical protein [Eubacteriales bacterium]
MGIKSLFTALLCAGMMCVTSTYMEANRLTALGAEQQSVESVSPSAASYPVSPMALKPDTDGYYSFQLEVPAFDRVVLSWTSQENPGFSLRVIDPLTGEWGDWQPINESGQSYLRNIGGLFGFNLFQSDAASLTMEIRAEKNKEAGLQDIQLSFSSEESKSSSTIVMIVVMLAAGGALYVKKRQELTA